MWASPGRLPATEEDAGEQRAGGGQMASCWGRFGVAALWQRLRQLSLARRRARHGSIVLGAGGGLNYDPLSYAQNFDDSSLGLEHHEPDFTARFAPARNGTRA
ncbi:uncharacterized protein LOC100828058 [Brachypodium distachyon]|uniref:Uncharacterized protein n=1 Tax=Brachypodium distachyon TaxID=15368 RepID=A0A0Q3KUX4_BRADI|nr:uncharacterized protein LOC100828058 [Brachypodium distachyon]KQJ84005.1 hypothetical protein BRADI_5g18095v3 [Brachypodium distachyon]|eukprot:XP_003581516.1 uncharacterized protein LOC100828058 [Brachypodium distachyon]